MVAATMRGSVVNSRSVVHNIKAARSQPWERLLVQYFTSMMTSMTAGPNERTNERTKKRTGKTRVRCSSKPLPCKGRRGGGGTRQKSLFPAPNYAPVPDNSGLLQRIHSPHGFYFICPFHNFGRVAPCSKNDGSVFPASTRTLACSPGA